MIKRTSGVLMHITSLPSKYGVGTFGKEAYEFVDFLNEAKFGIWQILPLNLTMTILKSLLGVRSTLMRSIIFFFY